MPAAAPPASSAAAGVDPQAVQAAIAAHVAGQVTPLLNGVDLANPGKSVTDVIGAVYHYVDQFASASSAAALHQYDAARRAAGIRKHLRLLPDPGPDLETVGNTVRWALSPLFRGTPDEAAAARNLIAGAEKLTLDSGRRTVLTNVKRDREARGWARIPEPNACYFCALLSTRGPVYNADTVKFQTHNHCRCHPEPVFGKWTPSAQVQQYRDLYYGETKHGKGSAETVANFRRAFAEKYARPEVEIPAAA
jgi:hypothetical protein